ncbi:hypothetical protein PTNB85_01892 [Pyrenophora teres f. teres]|nr:hypothetical protein PTNB85_01892 [Pyrenophora teres f. teres]KAE8853788.1 hypothetical protein HRS9122_00780 [Pyrenophora teres f. teres]
MKDQKQKKLHKNSIRDFFAPLPKDTTPRATSSSSTVPQKRAHNAPTPSIHPTAPKSSEVTQPATSNASNTRNPSSTSNAPSTVTDAPPFNPSAASRRIISHGQQVVLNSDSDDDSLLDVDFGLGASSAKPTPKPKTTVITTRSKRKSEDEDEELRKPEKKPKADKLRFDTFIQTVQQKLETEQRIKERKAALEEADEEPINNTTAITEDALGQVVQDDDDPDKAHRLFLAMQRTNAMQMQSTFHFFSDPSDSIPVLSKFPARSLPGQRWASSLKDPSARDQAFMTGFVQQVFRVQHLPEELASWIIDQFCSNHNESLNSRYLDILESHHEHLETLLDPERLHVLFKAIGANMDQLDRETELAPTSLPKSEHSLLLPPTLKSVARLLQGAALWLRTKARSHALFMLCHDAIEALICNFADNHRLNSAVGSPLPKDVQSLISSQLSDIIPQLLVKVTHPMLQRNLIRAFPARSPLTAYLQRHLALAFLLYPVSVDVPLADPKVSDILLGHLDKSSGFRVDRDVDYSLLAAQLTLLDIAIGPGLSTVPYQPLLSPTPSQAGSSPIRALLPPTSEVKKFNNQVDTLARRIKLLGNSIVEVGTGDLSILEAKDCIERLVARLEHSVRIGGKKVHNVFGTDEDDTQPKLNKFFKKALKPTTPTPLHSIFDEGEDGV